STYILVQIFVIVFCLLMNLRPPASTLFPYTTLFRSRDAVLEVGDALEGDRRGPSDHADHLVTLVEEELGQVGAVLAGDAGDERTDRKSTRLNSSHVKNSYAVFCLKKKKEKKIDQE